MQACYLEFIVVLTFVLAILSVIILYRLFKEFGKTHEVFVTEVVNSDIAADHQIKQKSNIEINQKGDIFGLPFEDFISKAENLFDLIFNAFANSHEHILRLHVSNDLLEKFLDQMKKRREKGLRQELLIKHKSTDATLVCNDIARVSFDVSQMSSIINDAGVSMDNPNRIYRDILHTWDFQNIGESWVLCKTDAIER